MDENVDKGQLPTPGACGGQGLYFFPAKHWCPVPEAERALYILAGAKCFKHWWEIREAQVVKEAFEGKVIFWNHGQWCDVRLNSRCRSMDAGEAGDKPVELLSSHAQILEREMANLSMVEKWMLSAQRYELGDV